jgi:hypothetical protein
MTTGHRDPHASPAPAHNVWTIARIQHVLTSEVLIRRFLRDLTHAPEHEVMNVFTSWRHVAATIEVNTAAQQATPKTATAPAPTEQETSTDPDPEPDPEPEQSAP